MEYLEFPHPIPDEYSPHKKGEVGILEDTEHDGLTRKAQDIFCVVLYTSNVGEYRILAKCADKFLAHSIRLACEEQLDREAAQKLYKRAAEALFEADRLHSKPWEACQLVKDGQSYCLQDDCPHTGSCPHFHP